MQSLSIIVVFSALQSAFASILVEIPSGSYPLGYTKVSYTKELCMSECRDNKCFTGWNMVQKPCVQEQESSRLYYTEENEKKPKCWSRCGNFGYKYEWCFVDDNGHWDYCDSKTERFPLGFAAESYTKELCMSECVNNECFTGWDMIKKPCVQGNETAKLYYTAQTQKIPICWSRCGKFGYDYEWCLVNEKGDWDYCNSETNNRQVVRQFTIKDEPCSTPCALDASDNEYKCKTLWGNQGFCDPKKEYKYVQAKTIYGVDCASKCDKFGKSYYWCYDMNRVNNYCAQPAKTVEII